MDKKIDILSLNKEAWENIAQKYEKNRPKWLDKPYPLFKFFCSNLSPGSCVLDLGFGTGLPYAKLLVENNFKVLGIDLSNEMVRIARQNVPQAKFIQLSMTDLEYENKFEGVFSSFSMLQLEPRQFKNVAERIVRALKKDGVLYISLNEPLEGEEDIDSYNYTIIEIMGQNMYSRPYSETEVKAIFEPLGMMLLKVHREIQVSDLFGEEHTITFVFKKN